MNIIKNKKALSHVEFIISLVIFVTFVLFFLAFLNPLSKDKDNPAFIDSLEKQIIDYGKIKVLTGTIMVNDAGNKDCFAIESLANKKVIVRKDGKIGAENAADLGEGNGDIDTSIENKGNGIYSLYYSDDLKENSLNKSCEELNGSGYGFGLTREINIVSLERLKGLADVYNNRYADAKDIINVSNDFGFIVYDLNGTEIIKAFKQKTAVDVNAREINIEAIDSDANIKSVIINLRVW